LWAAAQYEQNKGIKKMLVQGLSENEAKNYFLLHALFNSSKRIHDFHLYVFGHLNEHFYMKCFNKDVEVELDIRVWPSMLNQCSHCQEVYNPITL
jgi:hypothetical protein